MRTARLLPMLALVAGVAAAQDEAASIPPAREEAFKLVDAYLISNMQESLGLSDEQFAKAIPLVKTLQKERREYLLERGRLLHQMRRTLRRGGAPESEVVELLEESKRLEAQGSERTRRNLEALDAILTPLQQAKYRVLEGEVEQRVRELTARARAARPARQRNGQPAPGPPQR